MIHSSNETAMNNNNIKALLLTNYFQLLKLSFCPTTLTAFNFTLLTHMTTPLHLQVLAAQSAHAVDYRRETAVQ